MRETIKVDVFAGDLYTLRARILPMIKALGNYNVRCRIVPPIAWNSIVKGKLGSVFSLALTHPLKSYVDTLIDPCDVVVIGRVSTPQVRLLQKLVRSKGVKLIFDLDDPLFLPTGKLLGLNFRPGSLCLEEVIKNADHVTVSGHYLLRYANSLNNNADIIHDAIDVDLFVPTSRNHPSKITIGWHGAPKAHYENLRMLVKPLEKIGHKYDLRFKVVSYLGDPKVKQMFEPLEKLVEVDYGLDHWVPLAKYAQLMSDFDIAVAPLQRTPWYEGKSALRVGLSMAMGVPVVASSVGEQKYVIKHGINGFLTRTEEEWSYYLKLLIDDERLRRSIGSSGRKTAETELSLQECGRKLDNIIRRL